LAKADLKRHGEVISAGAVQSAIVNSLKQILCQQPCCAWLVADRPTRCAACLWCGAGMSRAAVQCFGVAEEGT
jgi:predicted RNA-binding Zn ribbon-like protein